MYLTYPSVSHFWELPTKASVLHVEIVGLQISLWQRMAYGAVLKPDKWYFCLLYKAFLYHLHLFGVLVTHCELKWEVRCSQSRISKCEAVHSDSGVSVKQDSYLSRLQQ